MSGPAHVIRRVTAGAAAATGAGRDALNGRVAGRGGSTVTFHTTNGWGGCASAGPVVGGRRPAGGSPVDPYCSTNVPRVHTAPPDGMRTAAASTFTTRSCGT